MYVSGENQFRGLFAAWCESAMLNSCSVWESVKVVRLLYFGLECLVRCKPQNERDMIYTKKFKAGRNVTI